jgi:DNA-binding CsgD family transcriptional regulator
MAITDGSPDISRLIRTTVRHLYADGFSLERLMDLVPGINRVFQSHYFGVLLLPTRAAPKPFYISNNDPGYTDLYRQLVADDFILGHLKRTGRPTLLSGFGEDQLRRNRQFCVEALRGRPIADLYYVPVRSETRLYGYISFSRGGVNPSHRGILGTMGGSDLNRPYNEDELAQMRLLGGIISDGIFHALRPPPPLPRCAYLDGCGHVQTCGQEIEEALADVFGARYRHTPGFGDAFCHRAFAEALRGVAQRTLGIAGTVERRIELPGRSGRLYRFRLTPRTSRWPLEHFPGEPSVSLELDPPPQCVCAPVGPSEVTDPPPTTVLTRRESEVRCLLCRGLSNKAIGGRLGISEATVKVHLFHLYAKLGVRSRAELIAGASRTVPG